jgi:AcrR family transcriptional regulator
MTTGIYQNHRENQRDWILNIAEDLFIQNGIDNVTIGEIAEASRLTRATIYKYFANKELIAQEIFKVVTRGWVERNERDVWHVEGSGYAQIERFLTSHFNYLFQTPREARFVAEFNYLYAKKWPAETVKKLFLETLGVEREHIGDCIRRGQADGSLRGDIDAELMLAAVFNFNSGMLSRLGEMGNKIEGEYGLDVQVIFSQICRVFLDGLKTQSYQDECMPQN